MAIIEGVIGLDCRTRIGGDVSGASAGSPTSSRVMACFYVSGGFMVHSAGSCTEDAYLREGTGDEAFTAKMGAGSNVKRATKGSFGGRANGGKVGGASAQVRV